MSRLPALLAMVTALIPSVAAAQPAPPIATQSINRAWGSNDGLPQNTVTSMVQTRDGYLWIGTFGGLVRFDGQAFTIFDPGTTPGLVSSRIVALHEDRQGVLWIGTEGGLSRYERGRFTGFTNADGLPQGGVLAILDDRRGRKWISTGTGLLYFDGRTFQVPPSGLVTPNVSMTELPNGDIWTATWDDVARYSGGELAEKTVALPDPKGSEVARVLLFDSRGRLWFGSRKLMLWRGDRFETVALPGNRDDSSISALADGGDGSIWIGTHRSGLLRWRDGHVDVYDERDGLTNNFVKSLLVDTDGNIWVGTNVGGLVRLKPRRAFSYPLPGALEQSIGPITDDGAGGLWVGATCGGLRHFRDGVFDRVYGVKDGIHDCIWALWRDPDNTLWAGSMGGGIYRLKDGRFTSFKHDQFVRNLINVITRDRDGVLWAGTGTGLARLDGDRLTYFDRDAGVEPVTTITQGRNGTMWLGGVTGLTEFRNGRGVRTYTTKDGLSHNAVRAIHEDADGVLWIGTYGGGLNRFKDGRFVTIGPANGLHDVAVSRIIEDDRGNFWMSGNKGVYRVSRSQLNAFCDGTSANVTSVAYGTSDGMIVDETNGGQPAGWRAADGKFWFPTINGLVSIDPGDGSKKHPPVFVERAIVNGSPVAPDAAAQQVGHADAEFHYTAVDLTAAEKTRFRFRLTGYDRDWIDGGTRRIAYYTNIPPGQYTFEVAATNGEGAWSTVTARTALVVTPTWWQRTDVRAASLFGLLVITGLIVRRVSGRRARARVAQLEREQALDRERSRIARDLHDDLGSILTRIALISEKRDTSDSPITAAARQALRTMDELVWAVNARNDTVEAFALYAEAFAQEQADAAGMRVRLNLPAEPSLRVLHADARRNLFLACKEAITNAVKHSQASEIRFSIDVAGDRLDVEVADNGRGLPPELDPNGNGLKNYRERMDAAGGEVQIESSPGSGTVIRFRVPIES